MSQSPDSHTYTGPWINWSHGLVSGSTITLSERDGSFLIAFLSLFVTIAGGACWKITSYALHQSRCSPNPRDGLHHQLQAILRNSSNPASATWQMIQVMWYWRKHTSKIFFRVAPIIFLAILNLAVFGVAGIFSSEVTRAAGNETLLRSSSCGVLNVDPRLVSATNDSHQLLAAGSALDSNDTLAASTYARACYGSSTQNPLQCNQYANQQLHWSTNHNVSCPFDNGLCFFGATSAYQMDSGLIDSHDMLGINARKSDRVQLRKVATCSPIHTKGYLMNVNATTEDILQQFLYGPISNTTNYTYSYNEHDAIEGYGYLLTSLLAYGNYSGNAWIPIPALNGINADVSLFLLAANSVLYTDPVSDPFFAANTPSQFAPGYVSDQYVNAMACLDQFQYCNPSNKECTPLSSSNSLGFLLDPLNLNFRQLNTVARINDIVPATCMYASVKSRGANALRASETVTLNDLQVGTIPPNQWQIEVSAWFASAMAKLQQKVVSYATGPAYVPPGTVLLSPTNSDQERMCKQQIVRSSGGYISFSVLGMSIILIVGALLIFLALVLDTVMNLARRLFHFHEYKAVQWNIDEKLQLQRLAYEEAGQGTWSGGGSSVPVTRKGDYLGLPGELDSNHPRLRKPGELLKLDGGG